MTQQVHTRESLSDIPYMAVSGHLPYLLPAYLDVLVPDWALLQVGEHYFPLPVRRVLGFRLLEQPLLTQRFALVSASDTAPPPYAELLQYLQAHFQHIDLCLDTTGLVLAPGWQQQERVTYRLDVPASSELLYTGYNNHLRRILKKPVDLELRKDIDLTAFLPFLRRHLNEKTRLPASFYTKAEALLLSPALKWHLYGAFSGQELVAACAILHTGKQAYYQLAASAPAGKEQNAMHLLVNRVLEDLCGQGILFDFEGSMIPGLQRFYGGFGAKPYLYTRVSHSRLPWPLSRWKYGIRPE